ncbi:MAG: hypothetical protein JWO38_65 [Gemmataceae bacterium]|nr:hypothetical protein [Gemmataceae bacterium]
MSIQHLISYFSEVNPYLGANPLGNCAHCAVETARALTEGTPPRAVDGAIGNVSGSGVPVLRTFLQTLPNRAGVVLLYLSVGAPAGVYAVETLDHAYNFVVLPDRRVFLIDSNQHVFRQILTVDDFEAVGHNQTLADTYDCNYGDAEEGDDSNMEFYHWGSLHPRWHLVLTQIGTRAWYTGNGTWRQVQTTALGSKTID